jgi:hypothetical protein
MKNITKAQFEQYAVDVKGYDALQIREIFQQMRDFGTPIQDYLTEEELDECVAYNK